MQINPTNMVGKFARHCPWDMTVIRDQAGGAGSARTAHGVQAAIEDWAGAGQAGVVSVSGITVCPWPPADTGEAGPG